MEESWEVVNAPVEDQLAAAKLQLQTDSSQRRNSANKKQKDGKTKLCGFLDKQGDKGPIKLWKTRWFVYDPRRCQVYYYRKPQDLDPLGSIDISTATFSYEVGNQERPYLFNICTDKRVYHLHAKNHQTMMFWLQELQAKRREFNALRTQLELKQGQAMVSSTVLQPTSGLLGEQRTEEPTKEILSGEDVIISESVPVPESVGEEAALDAPKTGVLSNISFSNLKTELKNLQSAKRASTACPQSNFMFPIVDEDILVDLSDPPKEEQPPPEAPQTSEKPIEPNKPTIPEPSPPVQRQNTEEQNKARPKSMIVDLGNKAAILRKKFAVSKAHTTTELQSGGCPNCHVLQKKLEEMSESMISAAEEIGMRQEVIDTLQNKIRQDHLDQETMNSFSDSVKLNEQLKDAQKYIKELEDRVTLLINDRDMAVNSLLTKLANAKEEICMYQELVSYKDQKIMAVTLELDDLKSLETAEVMLEEDHTEGVNIPEGDVAEKYLCSNPMDLLDEVEEAGKLKEMCIAYKKQNEFLSSEILELNSLRKNDEDRMKSLVVKCAETEAQMYKLMSKYLVLFNTQRGDYSSEEIKLIVEDAISDTGEMKILEQSHPADKFGFYHRVECEDEEAMSALAENLDRKSNKIQAGDSHEMSVGVKWENYWVTHDKRDFQRTPELKGLVRAGVPHEYRAEFWTKCIEIHVRSVRERSGPGYYNSLLDGIKDSPAIKQIELDLLRTLPNNRHYDKPDADGISRLRKVLLAYSWHNPSVGYCQGLNRLAAIALLYLSEEDAFWCLVAIVEHIMPKDYYNKTLLASQADQGVFKDLLAEKIPRLHVHLEERNIDLSLVTFNWFLTVFVDSIPIETVLRIWDTFLFEGNKVLFRYALAVFKINEEELLRIQGHVEILNFMRQSTEKLTDPDALTLVAFKELNPFPMNKIKTKRIHNLQAVTAQLAELDKIRRAYDSKSQERATDSDTGVLSDGEGGPDNS